MKTPIPNDWDGEEWQCVQLHWPKSDQWLMVLHGVLSIMMRGRYWDGESGTIIDAQAVGREIWYSNTPLVDCDGIEATTIQQALNACGGGVVALLEGESDMITKVWIDYDTGELVVESGQCCTVRYPMPEGVGTTLPGNGESTDVPELPPESSFSAPTACDKAGALHYVMCDLVDFVLDEGAVAGVPWETMNAIQKAYPAVDFGDTALLSCVLSGLLVAGQGYASESELSTIQQEMLCEMALQFDDAVGGITRDQYDAAISAVYGVTQKWFTLTTYPTAYTDMANLYLAALRAIGPNDAKNITAYPGTGYDCSCSQAPPISEQTLEVVSNTLYLSPEVGGDWVHTTDVSWHVWQWKAQATETFVGSVHFIRKVSGSGTVKQMDWYNTEGAGNNYGSVDVSITQSSSDHDEPSADDDVRAVIFVASGDEAQGAQIGDYLVAQSMCDYYTVRVSSQLATPIAAGKIAGLRLDVYKLISVEVFGTRFVKRVG